MIYNIFTAKRKILTSFGLLFIQNCSLINLQKADPSSELNRTNNTISDLKNKQSALQQKILRTKEKLKNEQLRMSCLEPFMESVLNATSSRTDFANKIQIDKLSRSIDTIENEIRESERELSRLSEKNREARKRKNKNSCINSE